MYFLVLIITGILKFNLSYLISLHDCFYAQSESLLSTIFDFIKKIRNSHGENHNNFRSKDIITQLLQINL